MRKVLVWDCDETLWQGSIIEGDNNFSLERWKVCNELYDRGIVQCIASRNDSKDVENWLITYNLSKFFIVVKADLVQTKSQMIKEIMEELNIVKNEDIAFVDDNLLNLHEVGVELRGVKLIQVTSTLDDYLLYNEFPDDGNLTQEDRDRVEAYRSELLRKNEGMSYEGSKTDFLKSLEMNCMIRKAKEKDLKRCFGLAARANQMCASKYEITEAMISQYWFLSQLYVLECKDKYGSYGISGVARIKNKEELTLFVISCKLQGKGYGSAFLGSLINDNLDMTAAWRHTKYNEGVGNLFKWYKFLIEERQKICYANRIEHSPVSLPNWINITPAY